MPNNKVLLVLSTRSVVYIWRINGTLKKGYSLIQNSFTQWREHSIEAVSEDHQNQLKELGMYGALQLNPIHERGADFISKYIGLFVGLHFFITCQAALFWQELLGQQFLRKYLVKLGEWFQLAVKDFLQIHLTASRF